MILCAYYDFLLFGEFQNGFFYFSMRTLSKIIILLVQTGPRTKNQTSKTSLFLVFYSQKSKDWTAGPVFCSPSPVWLQSFSSLKTGLPNTTVYTEECKDEIDPRTAE